MSLLEQTGGPDDLKKMSDGELEQLAVEIRDLMIGAVSRIGGHLAPSLGVVELTLALHSVLDSPRDRIVWDVGHQCYAHKILTGRAKDFHTIRQHGGLSGFPNSKESAHDVVGTGHSSTSISYGVGLREAMKLAGDPDNAGHVACVIGDGALTGGIAYEALNQAGHLRTPLIVILNDNEMSIKPNVGAISQYLNKLRLDPTLYRVRDEIERTIDRIPGIRGGVRHLKESVKALLVPGMLFEELGFAYVGIIDGHDIRALRRSIINALDIDRPVLIHIKTTKGKGYEPAEARPDTFHGIAPFQVLTGETISKPGAISYTEAFGKALLRIGKEDERVVGITAAMSLGTGLYHFEKEFPERFFDVGIAEEHAVVFAGGMALGGLKPVVAIYSTFLQRAYDQLVQDIGLQELPVVFALDRAGLVGDDGPTHHGVFDLAYLRSVPNFTVMAPADEAELQHMLYTALKLKGPVAIRYPRGAGLGVPLPEELKELPVGQAQVLDSGEQVLLMGIGAGTDICVRASRLLVERHGLRPTVVNARFLKPLDETLIRELAATHQLVITVEEGTLMGGFGDAVTALLAAEPVPVRRFGVPDYFVPHGNREQLLEDIGLTPEAVAAAAAAVLNGGETKVPASPRRTAAGEE